MSKKRKHKQKQKKYNPLKMIKKMAREIFMDIPTETRVHKVKKKYSRKVKHKKRYDDE
tara:strand:+ start:331 stop:504 length:174 start_codon:yes stop_codon:yes gene_type:complete